MQVGVEVRLLCARADGAPDAAGAAAASVDDDVVDDGSGGAEHTRRQWMLALRVALDAARQRALLPPADIAANLNTVMAPQ